MDQSTTVNVNKYFEDYKKIYEAVMRVQNKLNGPILDKIGIKAEKLFDEVTAALGTDSGMSRKDTIEFLKKLRTACLALVELKNYLINYITQQLEQIKTEDVSHEAVMDVQEIAPEQLVEQTTQAINQLGGEQPVQAVENTVKKLTLMQ